MNGKIVSLMVSADWHLGATDPTRFKLELIKTIDSTLRKKKSLDLFVVAGDTFDMKEYLSSDTVKVFLQIMIELLDMTEQYGTKFRFIEGTSTHDAMQLETLEIIFNQVLKSDRIRFIHTVDTEELLDLKILYVPEEYVADSDVYYKTAFSDHYDFMFGHGMTDIMWYMRKQKSDIDKLTSAPVFSVDTLCNVANYIYFGHVHYRMESGPDKRFKSLGPVSRWEFGKEQPCGIYYISYDKNSEVAFEEFIENKYAPVLSTTAISVDKDYDLAELNKTIRRRLDRVTEVSDRIRLVVVIDSTLETFIVMRDFIMASFGNIPNVNLVLKVLSKDDSDETIANEPEPIINKIEEKPYLYDKSMQDEVKIAAFIKKKAGVNISVEDVLGVIHPKDTKIKLEG